MFLQAALMATKFASRIFFQHAESTTLSKYTRIMMFHLRKVSKKGVHLELVN